MLRKLAVAALIALALPAVASARTAAGSQRSVTPNIAPQSLRAFLLRADEASATVYSRTPSFTWAAIRQPGSYEFELAMSRTFDESQILYTKAGIAQPAVAVPLQLPWMTGQPFALWAHVRFRGKDGRTTPWSVPFGFNTRWRDDDVPKQADAPLGLIRWTPVEGATAYEVIYTDMSPAQSFYTTTNVADEREFWTFHSSAIASSTINWRVRAVRYIDTAGLPNGLPAASYGPWTQTFSTVLPPSTLLSGPLAPAATVSDDYAKVGQRPHAHNLSPGFAWTGAATIPGISVGSPLYRVYVSTDDNCVNDVMTGAVVGSPAYAPRVTGGPLALPGTIKALLRWQAGFYKGGGGEGNAYSATGEAVIPNENAKKPVGGKAPAEITLNGRSLAHTDLWDSGWPNGRYYWTVVPVSTVFTPVEGDVPTDPSIEYHDTAVPQDACQAGRVMSFGKVTDPVVATSSTPFASGLSPSGRMTAAVRKAPTFHATPLVAWQPATGAQTYEVQWSKQRYPWAKAGSMVTAGTSVVLDQITQPGTWYYRVRGINPSLPSGAQNMTWSAPVEIRISGDVFAVVR